ncbi:MAG: hypothetical protein AB7F99_09470 [Vicinamibacterales bacterium]
MKRIAIVTAILWMSCAAYLAAQPDPDVVEALKYLDRASGSLDEALTESDRRRNIEQWISKLFAEGEAGVKAIRDALDEFEWASNPIKMIVAQVQDVLGGVFPFLALGGVLRERQWRGRAKENGWTGK